MNSQSVEVCLGRLVRHVNLVVIATLAPTRPHPTGLLLLFLVKAKIWLPYHRVFLLAVQSGIRSLSFQFLDHSTPTACRGTQSESGPILIERSCNLFDSIRFKYIILLHIIEA